MKKKIILVSGVILLITVLVLSAGYAFSPRIRESIDWRIDSLRVRIIYALNPPEKAVFVPNTTPLAVIQTTTPTVTSTPAPTAEKSPTPTATPTALPSTVYIENVPYIHQHGLWNYCGPANLTMPLKFWGWTGTREDIGPIVKPYEKDKNVSPSEMVAFVEEHTQFKAEVRYGATIEMAKKLLANGYPVLIEKGYVVVETLTGKEGWMGHYNVIIGYDDTTQQFTVHDSYVLKGKEFPVDGENMKIDYAALMEQWQAFNYLFIIVYPQEQKDKLSAVLGEYNDYANSGQIASKIAISESNKLDGRKKFFALFNLGTSYVALADYTSASKAYDQAFSFYNTLPETLRPWRITWYQFGPYISYYYTGRYQDVVALTSQTLELASDPVLEESYYWRAMAEVKLGQNDAAIVDLRSSLKYHPGYQPSLELLKQLGLPE